MLLATTAIEETWGLDEEILFLGEWCKVYKKKYLWENKNYLVSKFHWDDRTKLFNDEKSLNATHDKLIKIISNH